MGFGRADGSGYLVSAVVTLGGPRGLIRYLLFCRVVRTGRSHGVTAVGMAL
jgi:hypothetical protein